VSQLHVDLRALEGLSTGLAKASVELSGCARALAQVSSGALGARTLDEACAEFLGAWRHGTDRLGEAADGVRAQVEEALRTYREVDGALAQVFRSGP
jgi:hypothetical protein